MTEKPLPPWANEIPQGAFITYEPTYKVGEYFSRFHKDFFDCELHGNGQDSTNGKSGMNNTGRNAKKGSRRQGRIRKSLNGKLIRKAVGRTTSFFTRRKRQKPPERSRS